MNILVIGGTGFIGSHFCDALLRDGHTVSVLSSSGEIYREPLKSVNYFRCDIGDVTTLSEALIGKDCVVHLASTTLPSTSNLNPMRDVSSNLINTLELLELLRKNGPKRILFLSSGGTVYGEPLQLPVPEAHPLNPICSYGVVKVAIEKYLSIYQKFYGLEPIVLRVSNPYGPRQGHVGVQGIISAFLSCVLKKQELTVWGDGEIIRDYIFVSDLIDLCVKSLMSNETGLFNVGSGQGHSVNEVIDVIRTVTNQSPSVVYNESRPYDVKSVYLDITKAERTFNWQVKTSLYDGVKKHWEWLQQVNQ